MNAKKTNRINGISRRFLISFSFPIHEGGRLAYRGRSRNPEYGGGREEIRPDGVKRKTGEV
jgi:hypothetical protein